MLDSDLRVRRVNRAFCDTFGLARADAENCLLSELAAGEWNRPELDEALRNVIASRVPLANFELTRTTPEAGHRTLHIEARNLREDPQLGELVLLSVDDVTERDRTAHAARELAVLFDHSRDAMIVHELNGPIRQWNHAASTVYGWTVAEAVGKTADLLLKTRRQVPYQEVEAALRRDGFWGGEQVATTRDGRKITAQVELVLLRHEDGTEVVLEMHHIA